MIDKALNDKRMSILDEIDEVTAPDEVTPEHAIEFLKELSAEIDDRIEALQDENDL